MNINMKQMTNNEYKKFSDSFCPKSPVLKNMCFAFLFGGLICTIGQGFLDFYIFLGLDKTDASSAVSITLIFIGALLTGLDVYDNIAKIAGAGTIVPITGFANSIVSPAMEFKSEGFILGMAVKMFSIAGPVIVFGICTSFVGGLIYLIATSLF